MKYRLRFISCVLVIWFLKSIEQAHLHFRQNLKNTVKF